MAVAVAAVLPIKGNFNLTALSSQSLTALCTAIGGLIQFPLHSNEESGFTDIHSVLFLSKRGLCLSHYHKALLNLATPCTLYSFARW